MKKQRVVQLDDLISHIGQDRLIEILSRDESLRDELEKLKRPVWDSFFDINLTAYILSFVFNQHSEAFILSLVCKLWANAFKTKTFWRRFLTMKYKDVADPTFDPFHHLIWPKYMDHLIMGKVSIYDKDPNEYFVLINFDNQWIQYFLQKVPFTVSLTFYTETKEKCKFLFNGETCGKMIVCDAHRIQKNFTGEQLERSGTFCIRCGNLSNDSDFVAKSADKKEGRKSFFKPNTHYSVMRENIIVDGTILYPEFALKGTFIMDSQSLDSQILPNGTLFIKSSSMAYNIDFRQKEFWETYILGLKTKESK